MRKRRPWGRRFHFPLKERSVLGGQVDQFLRVGQGFLGQVDAAEHAGVGDRVGSLEAGKDADVVVTDGCPFEIETSVKAVFINGEKVFEG